MTPQHPGAASHSPAPAGPSRRAVLLTGGAVGLLAAFGALRPSPAEAAPEAAAPAAAVSASTERPHRTLLGVL